MLAPAKSWIDDKNVLTLLARVRPADFRPASAPQIVGPNIVVWGCETWRGHRFIVALEALRNKAMAAKHGTFADAQDRGEAREYIDLINAEPSVQDALVSVLGEADLRRAA